MGQQYKRLAWASMLCMVGCISINACGGDTNPAAPTGEPPPAVAFPTGSLTSDVARLAYIADQGEIEILGYITALMDHLSSSSRSSLYDAGTGAISTEDFPGYRGTGYLDFQSVATMLAELGPNIKSGEWTRGNALGVSLLNDALWQDDPNTPHSIALGLNAATHAEFRPYLDQLLGPEGETSGYYSDEMINDSIDDFLSPTGAYADRIELQHDVQVWVAKLLWKIHADIDLTDAQAESFVTFQGDSLNLAVKHVHFNSGFVPPIAAEHLTTLLTERENWKSLLAPKLAARFPDVDATRFAPIVLDSLTFAGGLSVPNVVSSALSVLYGGKRSSDGKFGSPLGDGLEVGFEDRNCAPPALTLTSENVSTFTWEAIRYWAPVGSVSWFPKVAEGESTDQFVRPRTLAVLRAALKDGNNWTEPKEFRMDRSLADFHEFATVAWAAQAQGGTAGPAYTHQCPAQSLSLKIAVAFFTKWIDNGQSEWCMTSPGGGLTGVSKLKTDPDYRPFPKYTIERNRK